MTQSLLHQEPGDTGAEVEALLKRVEEASGPDREINAKLALMSGWRHVMEPLSDGRTLPCWYDPNGVEKYVPNYTGSLDAAIALVEKKLPELFWKVTRGCKCDAGHEYYGFVFGTLDFQKSAQRSVGYWKGTRDLIEWSGATPALALIAALLGVLLELANPASTNKGGQD